MDKRFLSILLAIVIIFGGLIYFSGHKSSTKNNSKSSSSQPSNHVMGKADSKVLLVEYGDYECPFCQGYYSTVKTVVEKNKDKIRFQFRNFPLVSLHQNAFAAARAAEAASLQGKFWEMHDALYEDANYQTWKASSAPSTEFERYASELNLDVAKFKTDFAGDAVNNTINADMDAGTKLNITGTPTFFINGKKVDIKNDEDSFQKVIDAELAKQ